jgi:uncharacterized protein (DUF488 family)
MFYRRKIILALLQLFEGRLEKIRLQKLLFLFTQKQAKPAYDFVPYNFGCYSFSANADITAMARKGLLFEDEKRIGKLDKIDYMKQLKPADSQLIHKIKADYGMMNASALMKYTYMNFPFYAIKSEAAENILTKEELQIINKAKPKEHETALFTIGYEGISLEEYLSRLLKNNIKVLIDVRNNALSMKYGFSKSQLKNYCNSLGIKYVHIPEVGIQSEQRKELITQSDYDKLFIVYLNNNLLKTNDFQIQILDLLKKHKRIALTCFEADINQCHRKHLAEAVSRLNGTAIDFEIKHI